MRFKNYILLEMSLSKAASFAALKHKDQFRKTSGEPYIVHPRGVYKIIRDLHIKDRNVTVAAYLHDTLEDTNTTYNEIKKTFSKDVADLVQQMTNDNIELKKLGKPDYLLNKMIKMSNSSLIIKLADRLHNLSDIKQSSKTFANKMWEQTLYIITNLRKKRTLTNTQKKLIRKIIKQLNTYKRIENEI